MRTVCEIPHPALKITVFNYNDKFLIQVESGPFKQTYTIPVDKISSVDKIKEMMDEEFLSKCEATMDGMFENFKGSIQRNL